MNTPERTSLTGREYMQKFMNEPVHNADNVMSGCIKKILLLLLLSLFGGWQTNIAHYRHLLFGLELRWRLYVINYAKEQK